MPESAVVTSNTHSDFACQASAWANLPVTGGDFSLSHPEQSEGSLQFISSPLKTTSVILRFVQDDMLPMIISARFSRHDGPVPQADVSRP
jgi:hypothetical protein